MDNTKSKVKPKNMMYTQQLKHLPTGTKEELAACIGQKLNPKEYAVIVHDKDINEDGNLIEPHVHAMLCFDNARSISHVAKLLGDKPQYVEKWSGSRKNGFAYLVHATKGAKGKHQYSPDDVIANFDFAAELESITAEVQKAKKKQVSKIPFLLDALYDGTISKDEVEAQLSGSQIARYSRQIETVWSKRLQKIAAEFRAKMLAEGRTVKTTWIYGPAETGKTSLARAYAAKTANAVFISGSSRDIFQDYLGQHTIILDELRPGNLPYSDLLRITDPYGREASAPSRYFDKALAVDTVIITSPYNPFEFYKEAFAQNRNSSKTDGFGQLLRRLNVIIEMDAYTIKAVEYWDKHDQFRAIPGTTRDNPYSAFGRKSKDARKNAVELYNGIFEDSSTTTENKEKPVKE